MKLAFYIIGASDFQDMMPVIVEAGMRGHSVKVFVIDCLFKKRQLYYYKKTEILDFINGALEANNVKHTSVNFYGQNDKNTFETHFDDYNPDYVFLQGLNHKFPVWIPKAGKAKVVNFAWHMDSAQSLVRGKYRVFLNVLKREDDARYYNDNIPEWLGLSDQEKKQICKINSMYFGNLRVDHLNYKSYFHSLEKEKIPSDKKICFILEAHLKKGKDNYDKVVSFVDKLIKHLHELDYFVIWKKREKGYPKENWNSPLDFTNLKPDHVIEKDLNFPTSIAYIPFIADSCFVINTSSVYWDVKKVNKNSVMLQTKNSGPREEKYINLIYRPGDSHVSFDLLSMQGEDRFKVLDSWLSKGKNINTDYIENNNGSKNLLDYLEKV